MGIGREVGREVEKQSKGDESREEKREGRTQKDGTQRAKTQNKHNAPVCTTPAIR
jgi:hypothetical protein